MELLSECGGEKLFLLGRFHQFRNSKKHVHPIFFFFFRVTICGDGNFVFRHHHPTAFSTGKKGGRRDNAVNSVERTTFWAAYCEASPFE
eukprot:scaffold118470_cov56-Attheya_sp.AAC.1